MLAGSWSCRQVRCEVRSSGLLATAPPHQNQLSWDQDMARDTVMAQMHTPGVEPVLKLLDAADQLDKMPRSELERLLREAAYMLGELIERSIPLGNPPSLSDPRDIDWRDADLHQGGDPRKG